MKKFYLLLVLVSVLGFSQKVKNLNQGIYWTTDVQFAPGLDYISF